jgi:hypothetical protein
MDLPHQFSRKIIAGCLADFLIFLSSLPDPIIVGADYPRDRLAKAFQAWSKLRDFNNSSPDLHQWQRLCTQGYLKD